MHAAAVTVADMIVRMAIAQVLKPTANRAAHVDTSVVVSVNTPTSCPLVMTVVVWLVGLSVGEQSAMRLVSGLLSDIR